MTRRDWLWLALLWLLVSVVLEFLAFTAPIQAGSSSQRATEAATMAVLFAFAAPVFALVIVIVAYSIATSRRRPVDARDDSEPQSTRRLPVALWLGMSVAAVIILSTWGIIHLNQLTARPASTARALDVQVIGQQWYWTFRYPSYGGMESADLYVPAGAPVHFHVTSLDVVHSFWLYDQGIKVDAVPGEENAVWLRADKLSAYSASGVNWVQCAELCGFGHNTMRTRLYVVSPKRFRTWASSQQTLEKQSGLLSRLPPYRAVYFLGSHTRWPPPPSSQTPPSPATKPIDTTNVLMAGPNASICPTHLDCFSPPIIRVHLGQIVTWKNVSPHDLHDAVADNGSFSTNVVGPGGTSFWVPRQTGTYTYVCTLHLYMRGTVIVVK